MQDCVFILCEVFSSRLNVLPVLACTDCIFVFLVFVLKGESEVGASGELVTKDSLIDSEVSINLSKIKRQSLPSLQQIRVEVTFLKTIKNGLGALISR